MAQSTVMLSLRVTPELYERLTQAAEAAGLDRSSYCRLGLQRALGDSDHEAILANELFRLRPIIAETFATLSAEAVEGAVGRANERVREIILKRLGETEP